MSAQFVSLAVGYALGLGQLRRKGVRKRPWLELRRLETEATHLEHQVRALRRALHQPIRVDMDLISGKGYYDICRARIQSPWLERAIDLAGSGITPEALSAAGVRGLACLWLDRGIWRRDSGQFVLRSSADADAVQDVLLGLGIRLRRRADSSGVIGIEPEPMHELAGILRPWVHRSMRHALRPGSVHGARLLA